MPLLALAILILPWWAWLLLAWLCIMGLFIKMNSVAGPLRPVTFPFLPQPKPSPSTHIAIPRYGPKQFRLSCRISATWQRTHLSNRAKGKPCPISMQGSSKTCAR